MYFVENDPTSCADPLELNEEFEAQYDTKEYESKIARLLHNAHKRLKTDNPETARRWDEAIRTLHNGDHYLPVLWSAKYQGENRRRDLFLMVVIGLLVVTCIVIAAFWKAK